MDRPGIAFAYLHGFASGPHSAKGQQLAQAFARHGHDLPIPDLNRPSVERLTYSGMLAAFERFADRYPTGTRWRLIGSSMGGIIAARWAQLHADRIDRLVLLAPGFDLPRHWSDRLGPEALDDWQKSGFLEVPEPTSSDLPSGSSAPDVATPSLAPRRVHWGLMADARTFPPFPVVRCPTLIFHGNRDETVPLEGSERYSAKQRGARLVTLEDDHSLMRSLPEIEKRTLEFLGVAEPGTRRAEALQDS